MVVRKLLSEPSHWRLLNLVPLVAMVMDILENTATSLVMARCPLHCPPGALLVPLFPPLRWLLVGASFPAMIVAIIFKIVKKKTPDMASL